MMQISHRVDLSNISSSQTAVDQLSMPSDLSNTSTHSLDHSNKFARPSDVSNRSSNCGEGHRKSPKIFYVRIKKVGFDEDYIQVIRTPVNPVFDISHLSEMFLNLSHLPKSERSAAQHLNARI